MKEIEIKTYTLTLHMAGDVATARQWLREECWRKGLCVTLTPQTFIYTGGEEAGFAVGFVNYPRFPVKPKALLTRARRMAKGLMSACCQRTALLVTPDETIWFVSPTQLKSNGD